MLYLHVCTRPEQEELQMTEPAQSAKEMIVHLMDSGRMTAAEISEALGKRVSRRTIYRWAKGESAPQQVSDLQELERIFGERSK